MDRPGPTPRRPSSPPPASATLTELRDLFERIRAVETMDLGAEELGEGRRLLDGIRTLARWYAKRVADRKATPESW